MLFYRLESKFSLLDEYGKQELTNMGPYMNLEDAIKGLNKQFFDYDLDQIDIDELIPESFYSTSENHPAPSAVIYDRIWSSDEFTFGFNSMEQLKRWFRNVELYILREAHFYIGVYKVDGRCKSQFAFDKYQAVFNHSKAELVEFIDLYDHLANR